MARKIVSIPGLPQLPDSSTDKARYETDLLRVLWAWKRSLDQLIDENNTGEEGGGHIIQEEGVDLPDQDRLNFIGASVTAADDPGNGATTVTVTGGGGGSGTVEEITATLPIVVTPDPITVTGDISHASSGVTPGTYGDATNIAQFTVDATGHVTGVLEVPIAGTLVFGGWVDVTMIAGGAGGASSTSAALPGGGGGSGESVEGLQIFITPGGSYSYAIGAGGGTDTNGGDTTFAVVATRGGVTGTTTTGGVGGGARGGVGGTSANPGNTGGFGNPETATFFGGSAGGGAGSGTGFNGGPGGGGGGYLVGGLGGVAGGSQGGGGGGAATIYGVGGAGGAGGSAGSSAAAGKYGAGGGGGGGHASGRAGGSGQGGYLLLTWVGGSIEFTTGSGTWIAPS